MINMNLRLNGISGPICNKSNEIYARGGPGKSGTKHPIIPSRINKIPITIRSTSID